MDIFGNDSETDLLKWDLFKQYGQFNLFFEGAIARHKNLLIDMVSNYYGFAGDWEDVDEEVLPEHQQDRLLKIILHDAGAFSIVEKCRACFIEICKPEVSEILSINDIKPISITTFDYKFAEQLFKKSLELVKLRNVLIHSHYGDPLSLNLFPITKLHGTQDKKIATGFEQRDYKFDIDYFEKLNEGIDILQDFVNRLGSIIYNDKDEVIFTENDFEKLKLIKFNSYG